MQFATCAICNKWNLQHVQFEACSICNTCNLQHVQFTTHAICNICNLQHMQFTTCAICITCSSMCNLQHVQFATCAMCKMCKTNQLDGSARRFSWTEPAGRISWTDQLDRPAGRTSWTDQLDRPAGRTSWTDQLDGPAGRTSSLYLKTWPVHIFEDWPFSLYFGAASESDEGLVFFLTLPYDCHRYRVYAQDKIFWENCLGKTLIIV